MTADAQFSLATTLLADPDPGSFAKGTALIEEAAKDGHAEALCMLATMEAIGAGREQSWKRAFDHLQLAADRGSRLAQEQLQLLGGSNDPSGLGDSEWASLRARIDINHLLQVPERIALSDKPRIRVFPGFAKLEECQWVMARIRGKLGPAMVWDSLQADKGKIDPSRSNSAAELRLPQMDVVTEILRARISAATRLPEPIFEIPQVMHYSVGQEFKPHHDFLDSRQEAHAGDLARRGQRIGTFLIYLNENFEGGETEFPKVGISFRANSGDALFFANVTQDGTPDPLTLHWGKPPTKGEKWIISQWIRDRVPSVPASS